MNPFNSYIMRFNYLPIGFFLLCFLGYLSLNIQGAIITEINADKEHKIVMPVARKSLASVKSNEFSTQGKLIKENVLLALNDVNYITPINADSRQINTSLVVGSTAGLFNVTSTGAAIYEIPIFTSPGTAGMQPQVSIAYNSQSGNGIVGFGFNIVGLSAITRVSQNYYNDNLINGVDLQTDDRFALDGNRLILISGTYGANGAIYRTESDIFAKVTSYCTSGFVPTHFKVETKDGRVLEYGNTVDSKIELTGNSSPLMWRLNKITDANGNYINYLYTEDNGESYIDRIEYTGNSTVLNTYNTIRFSYERRTDRQNLYIGGYILPQSALLRSISVENEGAVIRSYSFNYAYDYYSYLNEIIETGSDGTKTNSTIINWATTGNKIFTPQSRWVSWYGSGSSAGSWSVNHHPRYLVDVNNDGRADVVGFAQNGVFVSLSTGTGFTAKTEWIHAYGASTWGYTKYPRKVADVNGDGMYDIVGFADNGVHVSLSTGYGFTAETRWVQAFGYGSSAGGWSVDVHPRFLADVDGDGRDDIIGFADNGVFVSKSTGSTFASPSEWIHAYGSSTWGYTKYPREVADVNGDGMADIVGFADDGVHVSLSTGSGFTAETRWVQAYGYGSSAGGWSVNVHPRYLADVNGDGKADIIGFSNNGVFVSLSTGCAFTIPTEWIHAYGSTSWNYQNYPRQVNDVNGDGLADIVGFANDGVHVSLSTGSGFTNEISWIQAYGYGSSAGGWRTENHIRTTADVDGDGIMDIVGFSSYGVEVSMSGCKSASRVIKILDGLNNKTIIDYKPLSNGGSFYQKNTGATYPLREFQGPMYAVYSVNTPNGNGGTSTTYYNYSGARIHLKGKGFLGFNTTTNYNNTSGFKYINTFEFNSTFYNIALKESKTQTTGGTPISTITYTNTVKNFGNNRIFPYVSQSIQTDNLTNTTITTAYIYDNDGNPTSVNTSNGGDATSAMVNEFITAGGWGLLNKLKKSTITATYTGQSAYTRVKQYEYDTKGNLLKEILDPSKAKAVTNTYEVNSTYGVTTKITTSAAGLTSRFKSIQYDTKFRFTNKMIDALGKSSTFVFNSGTGNVTSKTGIDNKTTTYVYDGYGRLKESHTPLGHTITTSYLWSIGNGPAKTLYQKFISIPGKSDMWTYFDAIGRELRTQINGCNGIINTDNEYYDNGLILKTSQPYYNGAATIKWINYDYYTDRRLKSVNNNGLNTTYIYSGKTITVTDPANQAYTKTYNALGNVIISSDNNSGSVTYTYHSSGQPNQIISVGSTITMSYDDYGRQSNLTDPNSGPITYDYNAFGELISQTDARNQITMQYDILGRIISKTTPEGLTSFSYVSSGNGIEDLLSVTGPNNTGQTYAYDEYGRVTSITENILGTNYITSYSYDSYGNNTGINYPSGFNIKQVFNDYGYLTEIKRVDNNATIWKNEKENALGQPEQYYFGNGQRTYFTYDNYNLPINVKTGSLMEYAYNFNPNTGNLTNREDKVKNLHEDFLYDKMNRLVSSTVTGLSPISTTYSNNGNISTKSDAGTYSYDANKKNAVTGLTGNISTLQQDISYNSVNKASLVTEGNYRLQLMYGTDDERIKTELFENNISKTTKIFGLNYEKETKSGVTREIYYIMGTYGLVAVYIKQGTNGNMYFVCNDHLGSIIALIDQNASVVERNSFDAWGRRRNPDNWTYNSVPAAVYLDRGFTGHEHLAEFGLINMNGRMYDPILGRMLSPDNLVQADDYTQAYNRYTYCLNNPLKYTDPSGNYAFLQWIVGGVVGGISNVIRNQNNIDNYGDWFVYYNIGNLAGSTGAATSYYGSYGLSHTKIGGALGGMLKGGPAGAIEEFISESLNSSYGGNSFGSSVDAGWDAGKEGYKWGTVLGGLGGGIDAVLKHRNFWNGAEIHDEVSTPSQNIPGIAQRGRNNCLPGIGENVDASFGDNNTQEELRNLPGLGGNPENDPLDDLRFWSAYSKETGHTFIRDTDKSLDRILEGMNLGNTRVAITQDGIVGHEVVMSSIIKRTSTYINGTSSSRLLYYVFNPGNGGSFQRISRSSILNSANIFYIFK